MRGISEAFTNLELGIAAKKYGNLHQGHEIKARLDGEGLTFLCLNCFEMATFYVTQPGPENDGLPELRVAYCRGGAIKDVPAWWYFAEAEQIEAEAGGP